LTAVPALTRERILRMAIRLADREGFEAVTLRRIATELDVHVTSLYNHVPTREAVTDGMVELLLEEAKLPTTPVPWEEWVDRFVAAMGTIATTHAGAFAALQLRPVQGPRASESFEIALGAFTRAGLSPADAYAAVKTCVLLALTISVERSLLARGDDRHTDLDQLPPEGFPLVRAASEAAEQEDVWAFAADTLVSGLRAQIRRRRQ
jgi:AcrR family transcriptional regulator